MPNKHSAILTLAFSILLASVSSAVAQTAILRVDISSPSTSGDGLDWGADAFKFLQDALSAAATLAGQPGVDVEIWVAEGVYRPDQSKDVDPLTADPYCAPYGDCDRTKSFHMLDDVRIFGGFDGTESNRNERRPLENITILSGDRLDNDGSSGPGNDNMYHVVRAIDVDSSARLDGFHIMGGSVGMDLSNSSPVISNCTIRDNSNGVSAFFGGAPQFINCVFRNNTSDAIILWDTTATLVNCLVHNNLGYGMDAFGGDLTMVNCTVADNLEWGGVYLGSADATIVNSISWGNETPATSEKTFRFPDSCLRSSES